MPLETWRPTRENAPSSLPGHQTGAQYSVQANLMDQDSVWPAMAHAYENAEGDLAERLLIALEVAEAEGGDLRGRQSVAFRPTRALLDDNRMNCGRGHGLPVHGEAEARPSGCIGVAVGLGADDVLHSVFIGFTGN